MRFGWDEAKRQVNLRQHGIEFADVPAIFDADTVTVIDDRFDYGETHYITLGILKGRTILVVHTDSEDVIRIMSARKATRYEEKSYFEHVAD